MAELNNEIIVPITEQTANERGSIAIMLDAGTVEGDIETDSPPCSLLSSCFNTDSVASLIVFDVGSYNLITLSFFIGKK